MSQIVVLNAGGQYCHLIARRVRELGVHATVLDIGSSTSELPSDVKGMIISGGPHTVLGTNSPRLDPAFYSLGKPILGICYGHQLLANDVGGAVVSGLIKEYGETYLTVTPSSTLLGGIPSPLKVWMSHGDTVTVVPPGFRVAGWTADCPIAAMEDTKRRFFGVQFHPEVVHTDHGLKILERFVFEVSGCVHDWDPRKRVGHLIERITEQARGANVFFLISGGIDSTVAFHLCLRALGPHRVRGLYVDTGFMRKGETQEVLSVFSGVDAGIVQAVDRSADFLAALSGVTNPEKKRNIIGDLFVKVQAEEFGKLEVSNAEWLLGQGTIYPDTIESGGTRYSSKIKTHHNRTARIKELIAKGRVIEPLAEFYKDEVRLLAEELGLPRSIVEKHPFPGPGFAVRCICAERTVPVRPVEAALVEKCLEPGVDGWIVPVRTVGVQGDQRSYAELAVISGASDLEQAGRVSRKITNEVRSINRVLHVCFSKRDGGLDGFSIHPATLTWQRLEVLREADARVMAVVRAKREWYRRIWQFPVGLLSLGLSAAGESVVLRPVLSRDGMTAEFARLPDEMLRLIVDELTSMVGIEGVLYDVTNKPPATIELE